MGRPVKKRRSLLAQVGAASALMLAAGVVAATAFMMYSSMRAFRRFTTGLMREQLDFARIAYQDRAVNQGWSLDYLEAHAAELGARYGTQVKPNDVYLLWPELEYEESPVFNDVPRELLDALPPEEQEIYAAGNYLAAYIRMQYLLENSLVEAFYAVNLREPYLGQYFLCLDDAVEPISWEADAPFSPTGQLRPLDAETAAGLRSLRAGEKDFFYSTVRVDGEENLVAWVPVAIEGENRYALGVRMGIGSYLETQRESALVQSAVSVLGLAAFVALLLALIARVVLAPLARIQQSVRHYRRSMDSAAATEEMESIRFTNEIGALAGDFISLMVTIDTNTEDLVRLSAEKERVTTELNMATRIQANMLPNLFPAFPKRREFGLYATMDPAKEVGGDFYDFFLVDDNHLALVVADVSGKGVPAALFMMTSRTMLKDAVLAGLDPAQALRRVNGLLCENNRDGMFVTVWLGILDIAAGELTFADAGHEKLLLQRGGVWDYMPKGRAPALAFAETEELDEMPEQYRFRNETIRLSPGDALLQYTDGVTEATYDVNAKEGAIEAMFGEQRLLDAVRERGDASPEELLPHIRARIDAFVNGGEQFDDITMLSLRYHGTAPAGGA